jgi:ATP-dependent RNA helicase DeaD
MAELRQEGSTMAGEDAEDRPGVRPEDTLDGDTFEELGLSEPLLLAVRELGYETPTSIQRKTIPVLLRGRDVIGQAPTGTGKTAAFALPILQGLDPQDRGVQALVLTPTRELAIQVAEALHTYSRGLGRGSGSGMGSGAVRVLPVYGGQPIQKQLERMRGGIHVVVGTPGRIMDHLRRGSLNLGGLRMVVLDEADEMLRMGFVEDVETILAQAPVDCQTALFSATMPEEVRRIADRYLENPVTIESEHRTMTVPTIDQFYVQVVEAQKLDALAQLLEARSVPGEASLVFVRTKSRAAELAERLQARGYAAEAMQGDMNQTQRETVIRRLRSGQAELVVATDVAARGLDVERIGMVVNYDISYDPESYVHRIGRTARAGRAGTAVLFTTPREQRLRRDIERYIGRSIPPMALPTQADIAARRIQLFKDQILAVVENEELDLYLGLVQELVEESGRDLAEIAAAAASLARRDKPLLATVNAEALDVPDADGMVRLYINAGRERGVRPSDIVGAIANEAGIPGRVIGAIDIYDDFTLVDVPSEYKQQVLAAMDGATLRNQPVAVRVAKPGVGEGERAAADDERPARRPPSKPGRSSAPPKPYGRGGKPGGPHAKKPAYGKSAKPNYPPGKPKRSQG